MGKTEKRKRDLREKYEKLREAGFSGKDANRLKYRSYEKVEEYCEWNRKFLAEREKMINDGAV